MREDKESKEREVAEQKEENDRRRLAHLKMMSSVALGKEREVTKVKRDALVLR